MKWLKQWVPHPRRQPLRFRARLNLERLETRVVPYATSGGAWPNPHLVTISFVPDGTDLGGVSSNLFATLNAHPGWTTATWQNQILKAAQVWAQQTNINFAVVSDNGAGIGAGLYQQGDPAMGDIRIGGFNFGYGDLAMTEMPPPLNNYSAAGDIDFNTGLGWNIGTSYDLFSVAVHEMGHALGLNHSTSNGAVMQAAYAMHNGLSSDDIAGVRNIYSSNNPRSYDAYYGAPTPNNSFANAADISSSINPVTLAGTVSPLDITTTSVNEYFKVTVPALSQSSFTVTVQSTGLSMLAPKLYVYNSSQTLIGTVSGAGQYGTKITYTVTGASAGQLYYIKVTGADTTSFGTGAYGLVLNFGILPAPTIPTTSYPILDGVPIQSYGGQPVVPDNQTGAPAAPAPAQAPASIATTPTQLAAPLTLLVLSNQAQLGTPQPLSTTLVTAPAVAQTILIAAAQGNTAPGQIAAGSLIDSGKGQDNSQAIPEEVDDTTPPLLNPDSMPAASGLPSDAINLMEASTGLLDWREASTACFTEDALAPATANEPAQETPASGVCLDHAAAATCLMMLLGGYWHATPEESVHTKRCVSQIR